MKPYSGVVKAWIRFPSLSNFLYKRRILEEIGGTIGHHKRVLLQKVKEIIGPSKNKNNKEINLAVGAQGPNGMDVPLKGVFDPSKHLTISFKEKLTAVEGKALKANNLIKSYKGIHVGRERGNGGKNDSNRNGKFLNMTLPGHGERFKASGNSRFPL
ncbi:hypothetical protein J1N35_026274 [Gossypium stocksii]|uniref:DUF4283 domain-containing protein n=1 Tax=Gossypium stocksii TaxID=47602 RepID=A0A9D3V911_9ROSI|nr:hypothetical protein J1N35_026274 [Gossypium stocksii]